MIIQLLEPEGFPPPALERLASIGHVVIGTQTDTSRVNAVFVRLASRLDAAFHARYPELQWIVSPTTGLNHIDVGYFEAAGVRILSLRGRTEFLDRIRATTEHTVALTLALLRNLPAAAKAVLDGKWDRYPHKGRELCGKTVLIYGYGRIGRQIAPIYQAFGCRVLAHDIVPDRVPADLRCDLGVALPEVDICSIHLPLTSETEGLIGEAVLGRLPAQAVVVNTSRGEIIDQNYLLEALEAGRLAGAALDVLVDEPDPLTPTLRARLAALGDRILVTPHIAGFTHESLATVETYIADVFIDALHAPETA